MTADIVLWLDLAEANQQDEASVRASVPPGAELLRLTDRGATPCPQGTPDRWPLVLDAIDRLVRDAREHERRSPGCRYWVTGRAGLPAFFHLGHRLGKQAAITFVHQPRSSDPTVALPLDAPGPGHAGDGQPAGYFARSPWPLSRTEATAPVALAMSVQKHIADSKIQDALARQQKRPAEIVHGHAEAKLDRGVLPVAMHEIDELVRGICFAHGARETLAVFIAGPTPLAFLIGNAINPRVCRNVRVFDYDGDRYSLVYELPYPPIPERNVALWLGASPAGTTRLALDEEIRAMHLAQSGGTVAERLTIVAVPTARPMDLVRELRVRRPAVVQFSGHGGSGGPVFQNDRGEPRPVPAVDLVELFRQAGDPVRLVVIAACESDSYADALLAHVDCVIVMRGLIDDTDARKFAAELYRSLAEGDSVRVAFDRALLVMRLERPVVDAALASGAEAPRLREREPGCSSALYVVRRP